MRILFVADSEVDFVVARELMARAAGRLVALDWVDAHGVALRTLQRRRHDACLVDEHVEGRSALEFLRAAGAWNAPVPILVLNGSADRQFERDALALGAADAVDKDGLDAAGLVRAVRRAVERGRHDQLLREENAELRTLHRLSAVALRAAPAHRIYAELVGTTAEATGFPIVTLERFDPRTATTTLLAGCGPGRTHSGGDPAPAEVSLAGEVARTRRPRLEMSLDGPSSAARALPWPEARTLACLPMVAEERVVGALTLAHTEAWPVDSTQLNRAATLANHLAVLVERIEADRNAASSAPPTHGPAAR